MAYTLSAALSQRIKRKSGTTDRKSVRDFEDELQIKTLISGSKNYELDQTPVLEAGALLLYNTRVQRTWLVATKKRLYCILDDNRKATPHINWSMASKDIIGNDKSLILNITDAIWSSKSGNSGKVNLGENHKNWLYSRNLFGSVSIQDSVGQFLLKNM